MKIMLAERVSIEFMRVLAGEFLMGSDKAKDMHAEMDEFPPHIVHLDEYWIGKYPVTVAQFAAFVKAAGYGCQGSPDFDLQSKAKHPVVNVTWNDAVAFCEWASKINGLKVCLPSEAQWEKAARGASTGAVDARIYPWGDKEPDSQRCNFNMNVKNTTPVGKYSPQGDSPYGCTDMAGNVWEWVADWYGKDYYGRSPRKNPNGPSSGEYRVQRGSSWYDRVNFVRSANRYGSGTDYWDGYLGFRCVALCTPEQGGDQ